MNRKYAVPAAIALSFHAILFLGNGKPPVKPPPVTGIVLDDDGLPPMPKVEEVAGTPSDDGGGDSIDVTVIERPRSLPEPPVTATITDSTFVEKRIDVPSGNGNSLSPEALKPGRGDTSVTTLTMKDLDEAPRTRFQKAPVYPADMKHELASGTVVVNFLVDENGRVHDVRVVKSPNPSFNAPTLAAVSEWRFEPGKRKGIPVRFRMSVPVVYKLEGA